MRHFFFHDVDLTNREIKTKQIDLKLSVRLEYILTFFFCFVFSVYVHSSVIHQFIGLNEFGRTVVCFYDMVGGERGIKEEKGCFWGGLCVD